MKGFSVIMPTCNQATYIRRAISSLIAQSYPEWELIIINDGCQDETEIYIKDYLPDNRIVYIKNPKNKGIGYALNQGLDRAKYEYIAYLPSDDYYYPEHLETLKTAFEESEERILVYSGADSQIKDSIYQTKHSTTQGLFDSFSLQLVQTAHRKTDDRWTTRSEFISDDLFLLFWHKLVDKGLFYYTDKVTSVWSIHANQHHKILNERFGGNINKYRQYYEVDEPIKIKLSDYKIIDEEELYKNFHRPPVYAADGLKILLVGELSYHSERIYALEEAGHRLFGLWMRQPPFTLSTVGPLPFGHIRDISFQNWEKEIAEIQPDIIYGLLNFGAIPIAYEVLKKFPQIPFVWHFKEGPFIAQERGLWEKLIELYRLADGKIYLNSELESWYKMYIPESDGLTYILDGDLPKSDYFTEDFSPRLSDTDGKIHTVIPGRGVGLDLDGIQYLAKQGIHIHFYESNISQHPLIAQALKKAPEYVHRHLHCSQEHWVKEFSQYDAGWLHCFDSRNSGNLLFATWDDLNIPARISTLAAAGLPMIQKNNDGHIVAMQSALKKINGGIFFNDYEDLAKQLHDRKKIETLRHNVIKNRLSFSFDYHVKDLIRFFREVIAYKTNH